MEASLTILFLLSCSQPPGFWIWAFVDVIRRTSGSLQREEPSL